MALQWPTVVSTVLYAVGWYKSDLKADFNYSNPGAKTSIRSSAKSHQYNSLAIH